MAVGSNVFLFCDLVERMRSRCILEGTPREISQLRMAIQDAVNDLPNVYNWKWYNRRIIVTASPAVSFTVDYDHTGGSSERLFTISSGTLPSWLEYGFVSYNNQAFYVDRRLSNTTFTVREGSSPSADLDDVSVTLVREAYPLPYTIRTINEVWSTASPRALSEKSINQLTGYQRIIGRFGTAMQYSLTPSNVTKGKMDFILLPAQETADDFEINAIVYPRELRVYEERGSDGTATGTSVFTSASGNFKSHMVGSVLRISPDGNLPASNYHFDETRTEYESQWMITKVNSTTSIEVDGTLDTFSGRGYIVSDLVDIMPEVHLDYLELDAMTRFNSMATMPTDKKMMYQQDKRGTLRNAVAADSNVNWQMQVPNDYPWAYGYLEINPYARVRTS
jgi:hypothetical protein